MRRFRHKTIVTVNRSDLDTAVNEWFEGKEKELALTGHEMILGKTEFKIHPSKKYEYKTYFVLSIFYEAAKAKKNET